MIIKSHGISSWNDLITALKINENLLNNNNLIQLRGWIRKYIQSNFSEKDTKNIKDIKNIILAYLQLNSQADPTAILDTSIELNVIQKAAKLDFDCFLEQFLPLYNDKTRRIILDSVTNAGNTALHYAALYGNKNSLEVLLEKHANPNLANKANRLPIHLAAVVQYKTTKEMKENIHLLLTKTKTEHLSLIDTTGMSLLLSLTKFDDVNLIKSILERKKELLTIADTCGQNALHHAILHNSEDLVNYLLKYDGLIEQRTLNYSTALHLACRYANEAIIRSLLNHPQFGYGSCLNSLDEHGNTALHYLDPEKNKSLIDEMVVKGANKVAGREEINSLAGTRIGNQPV